jgi:hypothetical protein
LTTQLWFAFSKSFTWKKEKKKAHETLNSDENINQSRLAGDGYKTDFENTN